MMKLGNKVIWVVLLGCLLLRLIYVGVAFESDSYIFRDTEMYYSAAETVANGDIFFLNKNGDGSVYSGEPLWPLVLSPFAKVFPGNYLPIRIFICVLLVSSAYLFIGILRNFVGARGAFFGGILYLFYPFYFYFSGVLIQEPLVTVLLVVLVWLICQYVSTGRRVYYLWTSANILALYYLRVTCIGLVPLLFIPFFVERRNRDVVWLCFAGWSIFILLLLPWGWRNSIVIGKFSLLTRTGTVGLPGNAAAGAIDIQSNLFQGMLASVVCVPNNLINYFSPSINNVLTKGLTSPFLKFVSIFSVAPLLIATVFALFKIRNKLIFLMYCVLVLYSAPYVLLFGQTRYRLPVDFIMIAFLVVVLNEAYLKTVAVVHNHCEKPS